jgi:hypothetical protein
MYKIVRIALYFIDMIKFSQYAKIKNNYCLCYFGHSDEYLVQLRLLKPVLESHFADLNLCFGCKDDKSHLLHGCEPILKVSEIKMKRHNFAHIRELRFNSTHPIEDLLVESGVTNFAIRNSVIPKTTNLCVIVKDGAYPTKPIERDLLKRLKSWVSSQGYHLEVGHDITNASWVVGVESVPLFEAAAKGIRTTLVPTGVGTRLYKHMFPKFEVWA